MSLFGTQKVHGEPAPDTPQEDETKKLLQPESADALLATPRRTLLLQHIWQRTSVSRAQFAKLYRAPIERYAALVQQFPASETHHHAHAGACSTMAWKSLRSDSNCASHTCCLLVLPLKSRLPKRRHGPRPPPTQPSCTTQARSQSTFTRSMPMGARGIPGMARSLAPTASGSAPAARTVFTNQPPDLCTRTYWGQPSSTGSANSLSCGQASSTSSRDTTNTPAFWESL
jgi:hypothetical protein